MICRNAIVTIKMVGSRSRPLFEIEQYETRLIRSTQRVRTVSQVLAILGMHIVQLVTVSLYQESPTSERRPLSLTSFNHEGHVNDGDMYQAGRDMLINNRREVEETARQALPFNNWLARQQLNRAHSRNVSALTANNMNLRDPILQDYSNTPDNALYITSNVAGSDIHGVYDPQSLYTSTVGVRDARGRTGLSPWSRTEIAGIRRIPPHIAKRIRHLRLATANQ